MNDEWHFRVALTFLPEIGDHKAKSLLAYCGSPESVFKEKKKNLEKIPGIRGSLLKPACRSAALRRAEEEIKYMRKNSISPLFFLEEDYPFRLKHCEDSPILLYLKGECKLNVSRVLGIVGSREASDYGKRFCVQFLRDLIDYNPLIVSGLAYGIDICAHKTALKLDLPTVGVLAHGLDTLYPSQHKNTAEKMLEQGGLLTEFPSGTHLHPDFFPRRNRIVAGLIDGLIVVEAGKRSGSLITADIANSYNRDVFAVPGRLDDSGSEGCNFLIKSNKAALIQSARDVEYVLGWERKKKAEERGTKFPPVALPPDEEKIYRLLQIKSPCHIDEISNVADLPVQKAAFALLSLEFAGYVQQSPGMMYGLL
jgi:DNA processing protein